ncbi:sigma-70 family RNA polymerase sigma factor [Rhizobium sp.]
MAKADREEEWAGLLRAALGGDEQAYRRFLVTVTPHLRAMAARRCAQYGVSPAEAEDVLQEVLLAVHLKRSTWDMTRPIGPWLSIIVRNKLIDILRRRGRHADVPIENVMETLAADEGPSSLDVMDAERLITRLRPPQDDIVRSISLGGASIRDTAERLKMTEVAVRVALHRALKTLARLYRSAE